MTEVYPTTIPIFGDFFGFIHLAEVPHNPLVRFGVYCPDMYPGIVRDVEQILGFSFCQPFSFRLRCPVNQVRLTQGGFPVVVKPFVKCLSCDINRLADVGISQISFFLFLNFLLR